MFVCRACIRRACPSVRSRGPLREITSTTTTPVYPSRLSRPARQRSYATVVAERAAAPEEQPLENDTGGETRPSKDLERIVNKHLEHLSDPYNIALHVQRTLDKDRFDEALLLTRKAGKDAKVTVSWNHLIDYQMRHNRLHAAIKSFNEMKKRAQLPNAQTYTILFKGCAQSSHPKLAVAEAVKLYHSMLGSERIKPNTIHMNAVLQVCARAGDADAMFNIARTAAESGARVPNNLTYTTLLNGLRYNRGQHLGRDAEDEDRKRGREEAIDRAKAIWQDVAQGWRKGHVVLDEECVCAMGRILLLGDYKDNDSVLSLIEQTMGIARLDQPGPALLPDGGKGGEQGKQGEQGEQQPDAKGGFAPYKLNGALEGPIGDFHKPLQVQLQMQKKAGSVSWAYPGKNTLSLLLSSLGRTRKTSLAFEYWQLLTQTYGVLPDAENYDRLLRVLQLGKASGKTAEVLRSMPPAFMTAKTFHTALSTCVRDNINDHAFDNANAVLDVLTANPAGRLVPDPLSLRIYLQAAEANFGKFRAQERDDPAASRFALGRQLVAALERLWDPLRVARNTFSYYSDPGPAPGPGPERPDAPRPSGDEKRGQKYNEAREWIALARKMVAAGDKVVSQGMADPATLKLLKNRRNFVNNQITRFFSSREEREPKLRNAGPSSPDGAGSGPAATGLGRRTTSRPGRAPRSSPYSGAAFTTS